MCEHLQISIRTVGLFYIHSLCCVVLLFEFYFVSVFFFLIWVSEVKLMFFRVGSSKWIDVRVSGIFEVGDIEGCKRTKKKEIGE